MKIVNLKAENFKRLQAVEISPDGAVVQIGGKNGQGKSSILDAIWVALAGRAVAPPKPIRAGEEQAIIQLDLGRIKITRSFRDKEGGGFNDSVKVESAEGLRYPSPQAMLDDLVGQIGFDPLEFSRMKPADQADMLRQLVPLTVDLDEHAELDASDYAKRRDVNREIEALKGRVAAIPIIEGLPENPVQTADLLDQMTNAGRTNAAIDQEEARRANMQQRLEGFDPDLERIRQQIAALQDDLAEGEAAKKTLAEEIADLEPLGERVDIDSVRQQLNDAESKNDQLKKAQERRDLEAELAGKQGESDGLTTAMEGRAKDRADALAKAQMPVDGLSFGADEKNKPIVLFAGVPFEQASDAEKIRVSTAIAMAANPELRVLRVKDGSLLDEDSMRIMAEMAAAEDFQLWIEVVGEGEELGIVIEDGLIRQEAKPASKPAKGKDGNEQPSLV